MCGLLLTNKTISSEKKFYETLCLRGPDSFQYVSHNKISFIHTLLTITGIKSPQPLISEDIYLLFNGEIYNYQEIKQYESDGYFILDSYRNEGEDFIHNLDGEFALVIVDFKKEKLIYSTDVFGSKPLFFGFDGEEFGFSSYSKPLFDIGFKDVKKCNPNEVIIYDLKTHKQLLKKSVKDFKLNQYKNHFEDWNAAFLDSIKKRFKNVSYDILLPLSSGHDSGIIACGFELCGINFDSFSYKGSENIDILENRIKRKNNHSKNLNKMILKEKFTNEERNNAIKYLKNYSEEFFYGPDNINLKSDISGFDDPGAHGLTHLLSVMKEENKNIKILASGQGGDEIYSNLQNYHFGSSNPKKFPKKLNKVFPWENFYYGAQSSYLAKEENIAGSFGIETRYPLLDFQVVQEYLHLSHKLKNKEYKSPISNFLRLNNYPFLEGDIKTLKRGFNV